MDNFKVSLVKYMCPICGGVAEEVIVANTRLTKKAASEVEELDGKAVGFPAKSVLNIKTKLCFLLE